MPKERAITAAVIGGTFVCIAAIISLGQPLVERLVDRYLPTVTPIATQQPTQVIKPMQPVATITLYPTVVSTPIPNPTGAQPTTQPTATSAQVIAPTASPSVESTGPLREHKIASVGTGVFMQATYSDGLAQYEEGWLQTSHSQYQRMWATDNPDGCGSTIYESDRMWISSSRQTNVTVNGNVIGQISSATGPHGYIVEYAVHIGDEICITNPDTVYGFQIVIGPDIYYHYDSYCYRGGCQ